MSQFLKIAHSSLYWNDIIVDDNQKQIVKFKYVQDGYIICEKKFTF